MSTMLIQKSTLQDLEPILAIYASARQFMADTGNNHQWTGGYPHPDLIKTDIEKGHSYLCCDGKDILGVFYFAVEPDPNYAIIEGGEWLNDDPYGVVHRIAVATPQRGVASFCLNWCFTQHPNVRIDTHEDNAPMRALVKKLGYDYCGIIYLRNGDERLAYHKAQGANFHQGSCLCGAVQFEIRGAFDSFYYCHCSRCRKTSGTAHAANAFAANAELIWLQGAESVKTYAVPDTRFTKTFCIHCGASLPHVKADGRIKLPAGSLDSVFDMPVTERIFTQDRALWDKS